MKIYTILTLLFLSHLLQAQEHVEKISKEFAFEKKSPDNALIIANMNGHVKVEGYAGDKIIVEATKRINAKTKERLDRGIQEIKLGSINQVDTIILFTENPCHTFGKQRRREKDHWVNNAWRYEWNNCKECQWDYDFQVDIVVKVPSAIHVAVSTINDGDLSVSHVTGHVTANNVNGSIRLEGLAREASASTINGDVDIEYLKNPLKDCRFYSLNGDINAWFQPGLAANMSFDSFNGSLYTNIDKLEVLPAFIEKQNTSNGTKYKVNSNRYKIGQGGAVLDFETFNGNVYVKEK